MKLKHLYELDGIRALAALMVIVYHFTVSLESNNGLLILIKKISIFGGTGPSLFFVLSGFLITRILLATRNNDSYFLIFYTRRALRIFPLYYLFLVVTYFIAPPLLSTSTPPFNQQIWFWVYLQNIAATFRWPNAGPGQFWSLAIEEHFYIFWPIIIYTCSMSKIKSIIYIIIINAVLTRILLLNYGYATGYFTLTMMDELAVGALLAIWELQGKLKSQKNFITILAFTIVPGVCLWFMPSISGQTFIKIFKYIPLSFFYFSFLGILITLNENNLLKKLFRHRIATFTGKISYGLYVYHILCFELVRIHLNIDNIALYFILGLTATYVMSSISYYTFELKFLRLKDRFSYSSVKSRQVVVDELNT
ncbi:acyltransferase family protein [Fibrella forsythiae]|uniref:Acyltransferase n=1 Tax=Fibrella forsythiae TaxID=2817061 RepID=A0ABS3JQL6_9BACT|nr:acyltransferase [Fibrella forsythiae]MBO0952309.1 acyltransferase [Fibrella forsythiae]